MWLINQQDVDNYENAIDLALINEDFFKRFKDSPYANIVGMGTEEQLPYFIEYINKSFPYTKESLKQFEKNDIYGGLKTYDVLGAKLSINTARYIKSSLEAGWHCPSPESNCGEFNNYNIVTEIGIGYGGLCFAMNKMWGIDKYHLIDLPKPSKLAEKYLNRLEINNISFDVPIKSDLVISEFALSELSLDLVDQYNETILKNSHSLYLMININDNPARKESFLKIISKYHDITRYDEYPKTQWPNDLLIGKHK